MQLQVGAWRLDSYWGRLILGVVGLFGIVPLLSLVLGHRLAGRGFDGYAAGVYIGTGIAVLWYTVETWSLRRETAKMSQEAARQSELAHKQIEIGTEQNVIAREQAAAGIRPLLISRVERPEGPIVPIGGREMSFAFPILVLRNIGHGPALFVEVDTFSVNVRTKGDWLVAVGQVDLVEAGDMVVLQLTPTREGGGPVPRSEDIARSLMPAPGNGTANSEISISYEDVQKRRFESVMQMGRDGTRLLRHRQLSFPLTDFTEVS